MDNLSFTAATVSLVLLVSGEIPSTRVLHDQHASLATDQTARRAELTHELTIYVDEGRGTLVGHVWLGFSDGRTSSYHGFYPESLSGVPTVWHPGQIRDDSDRVRAQSWDVKRVYRIRSEDYRRALDAMRAWQNTDRTHWTQLTHCSDFTEGIARAAGVGLDLPWTATGRNRPGLFGAFLRTHGGVVNSQATAAPTVAPDVGTGPAVTIPPKCASAAEAVAARERSLSQPEWFVANTTGTTQRNWMLVLEQSRRFLEQDRAELQKCLAENRRPR